MRSPLVITQRFFAAQQMMVVLGETVRFVTHVLQQSQGVAAPTEFQRLGLDPFPIGLHQVDPFFAFG